MAAKEQETMHGTGQFNLPFFFKPFSISAKLTFALDLLVANTLLCVTSVKTEVIVVCVICVVFPKSLSEAHSSSPLSLSPALIESL